jgi:DNA invertase Pin-like site-specific DNA recombinase
MPTRNPNESVRDLFTGRDQPVLRCAVYTRQSVANAEQDLTSCDVQRERCENYIRAMQYEGWQLLDEHFDDLGVSGAELSRPGLDKLKSWCVQGRVDIVVATRLDRLNRKMSHWVQLADWFKQAGIELVFVDGGTNARGPLADLVNNIVASFAEFERELIRERLLDAHARMRERGLRSAGRVPLGYKANLATRQLVIDEEEAAVVRAFFERCAAGESAASIARWANDAGHRTKVHGRQGGNRWSGRTVLQILRDPIYVGERVHAGGTVDGVQEGIIDADLARRAWRAIDERRTRQPEPRGPALDWDRDPYMLRGLLRCAGCERVMTTRARFPTGARGHSSSICAHRGPHGLAPTGTGWCATSSGRFAGARAVASPAALSTPSPSTTSSSRAVSASRTFREGGSA